jgi:hypothetical protein
LMPRMITAKIIITNLHRDRYLPGSWLFLIIFLYG